MIIPVRCVTCGKVLADKYEYYRRECEKIDVKNQAAPGRPQATQSGLHGRHPGRAGPDAHLLSTAHAGARGLDRRHMTHSQTAGRPRLYAADVATAGAMDAYPFGTSERSTVKR